MNNNVVILGPQGSGKGTQANTLAEKFDLLHIEMGLLLRTIANDETELGKRVDKIINEEKNLVSDNIAMDAVRDAMKEVPKKSSIIFDGVPRTVPQISLFERLLEKYGRKIDKVIYISLPREESVKRITKRYHCKECGSGLVLNKDFSEDSMVCPFCKGSIEQRSDDTMDGINKRLDVFYKETLPVIEEYRKKGILFEVDGMGDVEEITSKIEDIMNS